VAPILVLDTKCGGLDDVGVTADEVFHLCGEDVLSTGDDHLVVAAADVEQIVLVEVTDVARRHQPVDDLLVAAAGVALEREGVPDEDTADLALG
jgi:hypothetical protein